MSLTDYRLARQAQVERAHAAGAEEGTSEWREFFGQGEWEGSSEAERPVQLSDWMGGPSSAPNVHSVPTDSLLGDAWRDMMAIDDLPAKALVASGLLVELAQLEKIVAEVRRQAVKDLHSELGTWRKVGDMLGVSHSRAHKLAQDAA